MVLSHIIRNTSSTSAAIVVYGNPGEYGVVRIKQWGYQVSNWEMLIQELPKEQNYSERFVFSTLDPSSRYTYQVCTVTASDIQMVQPDFSGSLVYTFTTDDPTETDYKFVFGSCRRFFQPFGKFAIGDNCSDKAFRSINSLMDAGENIRMLLEIGDQVYTDVYFLRIKKMENLIALHRNAKSTHGHHRLGARIEVKSVEDDHAYRNNGTPQMGATEPIVYQNCLDCVNIYDHPNGPYPYGTELKYGLEFRRGYFSFFIADTRYERTKDSIMSESQWGRLTKWLKHDPDVIKFLVSPSPVFGDRTDDTWYGFKDDIYRLVDTVKKNKIENLYILSGDLHSSYAADFHIHVDGKKTKYKITEIVSSPFCAVLHTSRSDLHNGLALNRGGYEMKTNESLQQFRSRAITEDNFAVVAADHIQQSVNVQYYSKNGTPLQNYTFYSE